MASVALGDGLGTADGPTCLPGNLHHDGFPLVFGNVFHQDFISLLQLWIPVDILHHSFAHALLAVNFLDFVQDQGAFHAVARHGLDVGPTFGVLFDVRVNPCVNFRYVAIFTLIVGAGHRCGCWPIRGRFRFAHNGGFVFGWSFADAAVLVAHDESALRVPHGGGSPTDATVVIIGPT